MGNRFSRWMCPLLLLCALSARAVAGPDLNEEQRALIAQLTADKAITVARERRIAAADQEKLYKQLKIKDQDLRIAERRAVGNATELGRVRKERDQVAKERQVLVAALADRDLTLAAEVRAYRDAVTDIATSPDPRKQKALQRFADGEQREALADLDVIADAERAAQAKAVDIADAARRRPVATLALQAYDHGKVTLDEVIARYEQLTVLDPGMTWDWIELGRLYHDRGQLKRELQAAEGAYRSLSRGAERDRAVVLDALGDVAVQAGDLASARERFEEGLAVRRQLAKENPNSAEAQRDLSVSLNRLGDVDRFGDTVVAEVVAEVSRRESARILEQLTATRGGSPQGRMIVGTSLNQVGSVVVKDHELANAQTRLEKRLAVRRQGAKDNQGSTQAGRDLSASLDEVGDVAVQAGDLADARARFEESLAVRRRLAKDNPGLAQVRRDVGISLDRLGDVAIQTGDLIGARARFEESLAIARQLARDNPGSGQALRDVGVSLERLGDVALLAGDFTGARMRFEEGLAIDRELAEGNPGSEQVRRDVSVSLEKLGEVALLADDLAGARTRFEDGLALRRQLLKSDPDSAQARRDVSVSLEKLGDLAVQAGDLAGARTWFHEDLSIARQLAKDNPESAAAQRDLSVSLDRLAMWQLRRATWRRRRCGSRRA